MAVFKIEDFCKDFGVPFSYKGKQISKGFIGISDVFNKGFHDTDYHLGWNIAGQYLYSWIDGGHSLYEFVHLVCPDRPYSKILSEYSDEFAYVERLKHTNAETLEVPFKSILDYPAAIKYIKGRKFDPEYLAEKYDLRYGGIVGNWSYRIITPIYHNGIIVSYQGRTIAKDTSIARYMTLDVEKSLVNPKDILYNADNATDTGVVLEGVYNVFRWGDGAVASLGTSFTESQIRALAQFNRVIIAFDSEKKAQMKAKKLAKSVSAIGCKNVEVVDFEFAGKKDVAECSEEEIQEFKKELNLL